MDCKNWEELKTADARTADIETLTDIREVKINRELPREERIREFLEQVKNPYCFRVGKTVVSIGFSGERTFQQCMEEYLQTVKEPEPGV